MIVDKLENHRRYGSLHSLFSKAFDFLRDPGLSQLADGKHEIIGKQLFVIIARNAGRGRENAMLEFHRKYIDIQFVVGNEDVIGWKPTNDCQRVSQAYDAERDLGFFFDRPITWLSVPAGAFAIFFPEDAHAPLGVDGNVHKAVVKIAVE